MKDRAAFTGALDELQAAMLVVPSEVVYQPKFTYIWTLGVGRFPDALRRRVSAMRPPARDRALLSRRRGHDGAGRAGARDRPVAPGSRPRQPRAGRRGLRDDALARRLSNRDPHLIFFASSRLRGCSSYRASLCVLGVEPA